MKYAKLILIMLFVSINCSLFGQTKNQPDSIYTFEDVDKKPMMKGGNKAFTNYILTSIKYPEKAKQDGVQGHVFVQFVVEKNGKISNSRILRSLNEECDQEVLRIIDEMPKWKAGKKDKKKVRTYINAPVKFNLN